MRAVLRRVSIGVFALSLVAFASGARADCPACSTALLVCGQTVITAFQSCISMARPSQAAIKVCVSAAKTGVAMCQNTFGSCIATCTPAN